MDLTGKTLEQVIDIYTANLNWEGNVTTATNFLAAIRYILVLRPVGSAAGGISFNFESLASMEKMVSDYVRDKTGTTSRMQSVRRKYN